MHPTGVIFTTLCTSSRVETDAKSNVESVVLSNNDGAPTIGVSLSQMSFGDEKRPAPLGFVWGKKYRVTIEPID